MLSKSRYTLPKCSKGHDLVNTDERYKYERMKDYGNSWYCNLCKRISQNHRDRYRCIEGCHFDCCIPCLIDNYNIEVPKTLCCPITLSLMVDPVIASDGHNYESHYLKKWTKTKNKSPMTGAPFENNLTINNHELRNRCFDWGLSKTTESGLKNEMAALKGKLLTSKNADIALKTFDEISDLFELAICNDWIIISSEELTKLLKIAKVVIVVDEKVIKAFETLQSQFVEYQEEKKQEYYELICKV